MKPNGLFVSNEAKRLKELESENVRLKRLVATQALDLDMLRRCGTSISNSTKPPTGGRLSCSTSSMNTPGKPWPRGLAGPIPLTTPSTIDDVADLMAKHRPPKYIRMDNGPEMIAWTSCAITAAPPASVPATSTPPAHGRTRSWNRSTAGSADSSMSRGARPLQQWHGRSGTPSYGRLTEQNPGQRDRRQSDGRHRQRSTNPKQ